MSLAFNIYIGDTIIRIRQDILIIRKHLGIQAKKKRNGDSGGDSSGEDDESDEEQEEEEDTT